MTVKGNWYDPVCVNMDSVPLQEKYFQHEKYFSEFPFFGKKKKKAFFTEFFNISLRCSKNSLDTKALR